MDGLETARQIQLQAQSQSQSQPQSHPQPKILMVSAHADHEFLTQIEQLALAGYISKPISASRLLDGIMNAIGREGILPVRRRTEELAPQLLVPLQGKRILLVEDNEMNLEVASEF